MNGGKPVLSKNASPTATPSAQAARRHGFRTRSTPAGAARDDILDAIAVCRTATLIAAGTATASARRRTRSPRPADEHLVLKVQAKKMRGTHGNCLETLDGGRC
jgi:hypothetical protein